MPTISSSLLASRLTKVAQGQIDPLWVITGGEPLLVVESADALRAAAKLAGFTERRIFTFEGDAKEDYGPLLASLADLSLFGEKQLLDITLSKPRLGDRGESAFRQLTENLGDTSIAIITLPELDWQQKKKDWFVALCQKAVVVDCAPVTREKLPSWILQRLKGQNQTVLPDALDFIVNHTEGNLMACEQEIRKLGLLCPEGDIALEQVVSAVADVSRYDPMDLSLAILQADTERVARTINGLIAENKAAIPSFLWILVDDVKNLIKLRTRQDDGARLSSKDLMGIFASPQKKTALVAAVNRLSLRQLEAALGRYADIDRLSKGLKVENRNSDPWLELKAVALFLATK